MSNQDNSIFKKPDSELGDSKVNAPMPNQKFRYVSGIKIVKHDNPKANNNFSSENKMIEQKNLSVNVNKKAHKPKRSLRTILNENKQKRYLNAKNSKWSRFNRYILNSLNQKKKLRIEWIIIGLISLVLIAFFGTLLGIMQRFKGLEEPTSYPSIYNARDLNQAMWAVSIFSLVFLAAPYFYLMAAFFSGINQIHKSKTVHFIIWFTLIINFLLLIACCGMLIAGYYGLDSYNLMRNLA